jgi:hypothetical protein
MNKKAEGTLCSSSHYETDFGVSSAYGAGNTKIGFLKARRRRAFKKPIFIMRIADAMRPFCFLGSQSDRITVLKVHKS